MATKTFKIGLSNTDKQNMAQDVYERLLALTFPEYDSAESYDVGDFVVYNDQLYKCIGATSGAWDSTKWQLATLNDLLTDIEDAAQFVNDKANVDGNYPTMTVGVADQLSPYDDESGDDQEEPFSFQATGTANGTQPDFATGSIALMKEKQGNTVVVNQYGRPLNNSYWVGTNATVSFNDGIATFTVTQQGGYIHCTIPWTNGHKYFVSATLKTTTATNAIRLRSWNGLSAKYSPYTVATTNKQTIYGIMTQDNTNSGNIVVIDERTSDWDAIEVYQVLVIDLTQWFNGDIPQDLLSRPENFFRYYQGSLAYNEGELVNANGRYIKCIGRNQWDEEWENGYIDADGTLMPNNDFIRSKNYIKVIPNTTYFIKVPAGSAHFFYDKDQNYLGYGFAQNTTFTTPANCCYIKFHCSVATYNHDITISLYYEDETGYDQYYPYELLTNNDTGTEVLRSAGSVHDIKLPSGEIKRNIGTYTFTGEETTTLVEDGTNKQFIFTNLLSIGSRANILMDLYQTQDLGSVGSCGDLLNKHIARHPTNPTTFRIRDDSCSTTSALLTKITGKTINYELAEPTTEQGTPFSENLVIDDFGSMDFQGTNGVPQGNLIFYPVDYKAFIDTLYDYTEGTPSNIALKSDLAVVNEKIGVKLPECPTTTDGTYVLKATVSDGEVVYTWESEA